MKENVLCVKNSSFAKLGGFVGLSLDVNRYFHPLISVGEFRPRDTVEEDENYKQLIPYIIITHKGRVLAYQRGKRGGDPRLFGKLSIGIGGHVNDRDQTYFNGFHRELSEEVGFCVGSALPKAVVNDHSGAIERVHLGFVHVLRTPYSEIVARCASIVNPVFKTVEELKCDIESYEVWSQICIRNIDSLIA
jgi:predicted NUDIX family phosphoesterase